MLPEKKEKKKKDDFIHNNAPLHLVKKTKWSQNKMDFKDTLSMKLLANSLNYNLTEDL